MKIRCYYCIGVFMRFNIVVALCSEHNGIGYQNQLPWTIRADLKHFSNLTKSAPEGKHNVVIMGRRTWESLPKKPLPGRKNIVLSRTMTATTDIQVCRGFEQALNTLIFDVDVHQVFIIGGVDVYRSALDHVDCETIYVTEILTTGICCDTFFPIIDPERFQCVQTSDVHTENGIHFRYLVFRKILINK